MALTTVHKQPFRLLDLPAELRCIIYENIDFPTIWCTLDTEPCASGPEREGVRAPVRAEFNDHRVTLIQLHGGTDILQTSPLICNEGLPILKRRVKQCRDQPFRYFADYTAEHTSWASRHPPKGSLPEPQDKTIKNFVELCRSYLTPIRQIVNKPSTARKFEIAIDPTSGVEHDMRVSELTRWPGLFLRYRPNQIVITCRASSMKINVPDEQRGWKQFGPEMTLQDAIRETDQERASPVCGVFVRALNAEKFEKHMR